METIKPSKLNNISKASKEPYETPRIIFTEIQVEQALMGICKTAGSAGPFGPSCPGPCASGS